MMIIYYIKLFFNAYMKILNHIFLMEKCSIPKQYAGKYS